MERRIPRAKESLECMSLDLLPMCPMAKFTRDLPRMADEIGVILGRMNTYFKELNLKQAEFMSTDPSQPLASQATS